MNTILQYIPAWNGWIALLLYWVPIVLCAIGYSVSVVRQYKQDRSGRAHADENPKWNYYPTLKLGDIFGYAFLTVCPLVNLLMVIFDVGAPMIREFFERLRSVLDIPLVPRHKR